MESNREDAYRCIERTKSYILKKDWDNAWKFLAKANKLYPSVETKSLKRKLKSASKDSKKSMKQHQLASDDSDLSRNGDTSSSSSSDDSILEQPIKRSKHSHNSNDSDSSRNDDTSSDDSILEHPIKRSKQSHKSSTAYSYKMFKEVNKDESYKCLEKAEKYIQSKEFELAEKFLLKSKKLFHLPETDELFKKLNELRESNNPVYTEEQANYVQKVRNSKNYYEILCIKSTATVPEIKKAYKKLALLLHPDKNKAPGSGEMFIVVTNAVDTLCDKTKRSIYDKTLRNPSSSYTTSSSSYTTSSSSYTTSSFSYTTSSSSYTTSSPTSCRYSDDDTRPRMSFSSCFSHRYSHDLFYYSSDDDDDVDGYITENEYHNRFDYYDSYDY